MKLIDLFNKSGKESFLKRLTTNILTIAQVSPNFVYNTTKHVMVCKYNGPCRHEDGSLAGPECSGCIIGRALQMDGWSDKKEMDANCGVEDLFTTFIGIDICPKTIGKVQRLQDEGNSFKEATKELLVDSFYTS